MFISIHFLNRHFYSPRLAARDGTCQHRFASSVCYQPESTEKTAAAVATWEDFSQRNVRWPRPLLKAAKTRWRRSVLVTRIWRRIRMRCGHTRRDVYTADDNVDVGRRLDRIDYSTHTHSQFRVDRRPRRRITTKNAARRRRCPATTRSV